MLEESPPLYTSQRWRDDSIKCSLIKLRAWREVDVLYFILKNSSLVLSDLHLALQIYRLGHAVWEHPRDDGDEYFSFCDTVRWEDETAENNTSNLMIFINFSRSFFRYYFFPGRTICGRAVFSLQTPPLPSMDFRMDLFARVFTSGWQSVFDVFLGASGAVVSACIDSQ